VVYYNFFVNYDSFSKNYENDGGDDDDDDVDVDDGWVENV
jgi:hypothetical protein